MNTETTYGEADLSQNGVPTQNIPILTIPKSSTSFAAGSDSSDEIVINLDITTTDVKGNVLNVYSGLCSVKFVDVAETNEATSGEDYAVVTSEDLTNTDFIQPKWINENDNIDERSYLEFDLNEYNSGNDLITVEHHNTFITQNIINYGSVEYDQFEYDNIAQPSEVAADDVLIEEGIEYEDFLSGLQEEVVVENNASTNEGDSYDDESNEETETINGEEALKQLMTTSSYGSHKQSKTILFSGEHFSQGHTIQKITLNDPTLKCKQKRTNTEITIEDLPNPEKKKYQCEKCEQIFINIQSFKEHIAEHKNKNISIPINYICTVCGRALKSEKKVAIHARGHGDPDLECKVCSQVFASKFTLKKHYASHGSQKGSSRCNETFPSAKKMESLIVNVQKLKCKICKFTATDQDDLMKHKKTHEASNKNVVTTIDSDSQGSETYLVTISDGEVQDKPSGDSKASTSNGSAKERDTGDEGSLTTEQMKKNAVSDMKKVMASSVFLKKTKFSRMQKGMKTCELCSKSFDRMSDLKRHLIEHFLKSTITTTPVNQDGTFDILCGVCQMEFFTDFNTYRDHLRKHAMLTIYRCTICNKSFSDSSNFSKHKKIHGISYYQCDICSRKFHSKKMIALHMDYHDQHKPMKCKHCDKIFHFESNLNKHIKATHRLSTINKFRCRFCKEYLNSVKAKWDHEWDVHKVRKVVADCKLCGTKFRKNSELKRHLKNVHDPLNVFK